MVSNVDNRAPEKNGILVFFSGFFQISVSINYINPAFSSSLGSGQTEERVGSIRQP